MKSCLKKFLSEITLSVICFILVLIWFKDSKLIISGEEIFAIVDPIKTLKTHLHPWFYLTEPGLPTTRFYLPRITFFLVALPFYKFGVPSWLIQAVSYFVLAVFGTSGISLFVKKFFNKQDFLAPFSAGLFYIFNLYSLSQIWGRFIYSAIFAWALLPWVLNFFREWLIKKNLKSLVFFLLISTFFSHAFGNPGYFLAVWIPLCLMAILKILENFKNKKFLRTLILRCLVFFFLWFLFNVWWVYPYLVVSKSIFSEISGAVDNLNSLKGVSIYFPIDQILLLRQAYLFGENSFLFTFYSQFWTHIVSFIVLTVVFLGLILTKKDNNWMYVSVLAIVSLFISKGTNPPFGNTFYTLSFRIFPWIAGSLRNSYEKFGIVWLLTYTSFFALGIDWIHQKTTSRFKNFFTGSILFLSCGFLVWPMWTGNFWGGDRFKNRVEIPEYYRETNDFLKKEGISRIFSLPYLDGDGIRSVWGFEGLEPSEFLFDSVSISKILRAKYFDKFYLGLRDNLNNPEFTRLLGLAGVEGIVLHQDVDTSLHTFENYLEAKNNLNSLSGVIKSKSFGNLEVYRINEGIVLPEIYVVSNVIKVKNFNEGLKLILDGKMNLKNSVFWEVNFESDKFFSPLSKYPPSIKFKKIGVGKYRLDVRDSQGPYILVLNEIFNDRWKLKNVDRNIHFIANGFQNAWVIEKEGDYTIDVVFKFWPWE